ncbi:hypothetical protein AVEN_56556-1 [Araneus ventricosus]|uniref:Uncharacterized protein n=1 Tax=Araneus ventricosus TaxID=182803 RepID=A0A4Y2HHW3_ARAVE|nr:hypothetical protein AVEN_56556-1 [Araneus ventricosus]
MQLLDLKTKDLWSGKFTELRNKLEVQKSLHIAQHKWSALKEIPNVTREILHSHLYGEPRHIAAPTALNIWGRSQHQSFLSKHIASVISRSDSLLLLVVGTLQVKGVSRQADIITSISA